jgi:hypothetical protein
LGLSVPSTEPCQNSEGVSSWSTSAVYDSELTHARSCSVVPWIHSSNYIAPVLRSGDRLSARACVVPCCRCSGSGDETPSRHTRVQRHRADELGVSGGENVAHHAARGTTRNEDFLGINLVLVNRICNHVRNGIRIAATVMRQRSLAGHIPALSRRARPYCHVAFGIRSFLPWNQRVLEVLLRR